ncbi:hypothetical protein Cni_G01929 [Canna indica]|uniref:Uncharacterized protein n=1 Tax=Canna indica TaxID=4628 RepID=A0AAQ3Q1Q6_9LILI|nr:hypothetical protein Cni_G01929 [Canna indica]
MRDVDGGEVTMRAIEAMPLIASVAYEVLCIEPTVLLQYGRAKQDIVLTSHDAAYEVHVGKMLFGYQLFATKDS